MKKILLKAFARGTQEDAALNNILCDVPDTRQSADYSCGAAALQAVLDYWGMDIEEDKLIKMLKTSHDYGTNEKDIVRVASKMGLKAEFKDNISQEELERSIHEGIPVIVNCQAWRSSRSSNKSWADEWKNGHYMVVIGIDESKVYLEDPYILGSRGYIPRKEFEERWHNQGGKAPLYDKKQYHLAIFIKGERPQPSKHLIHIE